MVLSGRFFQKMSQDSSPIDDEISEESFWKAIFSVTRAWTPTIDTEVAMNSGIVLKAHEDVFSTGRQILAEMKDLNSDARRVSAIIEWLPGLAKALRQAAQKRLGERGRVTDTTHAVTLIGFERLEGLIRTYLQAEYTRRTGRKPGVSQAAVLNLRAPGDTSQQKNYAAV